MNKPLRTKPRTSTHGRSSAARSGGAARASGADADASPAPTPRPAGADSKLLRSDSDDHLSTYFRDLAEHDLLGPEQERELSQGIEDQEILTWERVLARADVGPEVLAMIDGKLEEPLKSQKYLKAAETVTTKKAAPDRRAVARLKSEGWKDGDETAQLGAGVDVATVRSALSQLAG